MQLCETCRKDIAFCLCSRGIHQTKEGWWVIDGDNDISKWVTDTQRLDHDQWLLPRILPLVRQGGTVVEAGAYIGNHTIAFLNKGCNVIAYEPNPVAVECLTRNVPKGTLKGQCQCTIFRAALGATECRTGLSIHHPGPGGSHIDPNGSDVEMHALDNQQPPALDLFIIDVEGWELDVLNGAALTIDYFKPNLVIEINLGALRRNGHRTRDIFDWLHLHGYDWHPIQDLHIADPPQYDIIARPRPVCPHCGK